MKLVSGKFSLVNGSLGVTEASVTAGNEALVALLVLSGTTVVDTLILPAGTTKSVTLWMVVEVVVEVEVVEELSLVAAAELDSSGTLSTSVSSILVVVVAGVVLEVEG